MHDLCRLSFAITWDYRCPFARNAHEHVLDGLADGADWDVTFLPFSLGQVHVEEGQPDVWDNPDADSGLIGLQVGVAVRDTLPERFPAVHQALFAHRHEHGGSLRDEQALRNVLKALDVDVDVVFAEVASGRPLATIKAEHTALRGQPRRVGGPDVHRGRPGRLRPADAPPRRRRRRGSRRRSSEWSTCSDWADLNEFKHTSIPH